MHALLSVRPHVAPRGGGADTPLLPLDKELFKKTGVMIVGVSGDAADKQKAFVEKQKLTVSLRQRCLSPARLLTRGRGDSSLF